MDVKVKMARFHIKQNVLNLKSTLGSEFWLRKLGKTYAQFLPQWSAILSVSVNMDCV